MIELLPSDVAKALEAEVRVGWELQRAQAEDRQKSLGRLNAKGGKAVDGLGSVVARIDGTSYHYWGQRLGYECWKDNQFMNEYLRDNPQCNVKSSGTKLQVGFGS